jgi:hypothetical protein
MQALRTGGKIVYTGDTIGWVSLSSSSLSYLSLLNSISNLEFDLDARLLNGTSGSTLINSFIDASINNRAFTQATSTAQPTYTVDGGNRQFLRFTGGKFMDLPLSTGGSWTFFGVIANQRSSLSSNVADCIFATMTGGNASGIGADSYNGYVSTSTRKFYIEGSSSNLTLKKNGSASNLNLSLGERAIFTIRGNSIPTKTSIRINAFTDGAQQGNNDFYRFGAISRYISDAEETTIINALNAIYSVF